MRVKKLVFDKLPDEAKASFAFWVASQIEGSQTVRKYKCPLCGEIIEGKLTRSMIWTAKFRDTLPKNMV